MRRHPGLLVAEASTWKIPFASCIGCRGVLGHHYCAITTVGVSGCGAVSSVMSTVSLHIRVTRGSRGKHRDRPIVLIALALIPAVGSRQFGYAVRSRRVKFDGRDLASFELVALQTAASRPINTPLYRISPVYLLLLTPLLCRIFARNCRLRLRPPLTSLVSGFPLSVSQAFRKYRYVFRTSLFYPA